MSAPPAGCYSFRPKFELRTISGVPRQQADSAADRLERHLVAKSIGSGREQPGQPQILGKRGFSIGARATRAR